MALLDWSRIFRASPCIIAPVVRARPRRLFYREVFDPLDRSMWQ